MKLLEKYILKEYIKYFAACLLSLVFIAIVFAAIPELESLAKEDGVTIFFDAILSGIPLLIEIITPISVLLATILTYLALRRSSELVAMSAAGFSNRLMVMPVMLFGGVICVLIYLNQSYLAPLWGADARTSVVKPKTSESTWRFFQGRLFYFTGLNKKNREVALNSIFNFNSNYQIIRINDYCQLKLQKKQWDSKVDGIQITIAENSLSRNTTQFQNTAEADFPVIFKKELPYPKYTSFSALISEIMIKHSGAVSFKDDLFALYQKLAVLISIFIMILLALPFSLYSHRESNVRIGIVTAVILGLMYFLVDQTLLSFAQSETMRIELSAFGANAVFLALALYLIRKSQA